MGLCFLLKKKQKLICYSSSCTVNINNLNMPQLQVYRDKSFVKVLKKSLMLISYVSIKKPFLLNYS